VGLILDTNVLISAERRRHSVRDVFAQIQAAHGETEVGLAAVSLAELAHGLERTKTDQQRQRRQAFLDDLMADIPVHPLTAEIAWRAGTISGQQAARGILIPFEDLLIGATALHLGFDVLTGNVKHFQMIPGLVVKAPKEE
jgi:predicted nucleic acid-binding protein